MLHCSVPVVDWRMNWLLKAQLQMSAPLCTACPCLLFLSHFPILPLLTVCFELLAESLQNVEIRIHRKVNEPRSVDMLVAQQCLINKTCTGMPFPHTPRPCTPVPLHPPQLCTVVMSFTTQTVSIRVMVHIAGTSHLE
jgi:hypothetical protein